MLFLRRTLLSHLSPSLLTKMSMAVLATLSTSADLCLAADNSSTITGIVNIVKTSDNFALSNFYVSNSTSPDVAAAGALYALTQDAFYVLVRSSDVLPELRRAQSQAATQFALDSTAQLVALNGFNPAGSPDGVTLSALTTVSAQTATVVNRVFNDVATESKKPTTSNEITIRAEQMTGRPSRVLNFDGQVELVRGPSTIDAETAEYHAVEDLVMANRNVNMYRNRDCYSGDTLEMQMDTGEGFLLNPVYKLEKNNAQGFARRMNFIDNDRSEIEQGTYTTCEGTKPDWYMKSSRLNLDSGQDEGVAYNGVVYFKEVPILAAPWMSFPISDSRRSGVLPPEFYSTTAGGPEIAVPYYFDIAPNRDATVIPKFIEKRGEQLGGEFRYLGSGYSGISHGEIIPADHDHENQMRYSIGTILTDTEIPGVNINLNYNRASDDQYAIDFSHSITASSQHLLPQNLSVVYTPRSYFSTGLVMSNYQVLQDVNNDIGKPYEIMPKVFATINRVDDLGGFDWSLYSEYASFMHPTLVSGDRVVGQAQLSYPLTGTYYFVTPKVLYHFSDYRLTSNLATGESADPVLTVPTFSLDSGLFFERETSLLGRDITQTLEPRLFYVKTPYRDQTAIPLFDTGLSDVNISQIFNENRFSGYDRVGDANQLTSALITREIEMNGQERLRFAVAQRVSFEPPVVVDQPTYTSTSIVAGTTQYTSHSTLPSKNDLLIAGSGNLTENLTIDAGWQYSESFRNTQQLNYGIKWQPGPMQVINAEYRFKDTSEVDPEGMKQIDVSAQWPLAPRWYGVARANFSLQDHRMLDGLAGFEYKQDCWIFRFVAQRYLVPSTVAGITSSSNTTLFFQLELNGLSKIGSNPLEVLRRSISGYQPISQPITQQSYQQDNFNGGL